MEKCNNKLKNIFMNTCMRSNSVLFARCAPYKATTLQTQFKNPVSLETTQKAQLCIKCISLVGLKKWTKRLVAKSHSPFMLG